MNKSTKDKLTRRKFLRNGVTAAATLGAALAVDSLIAETTDSKTQKKILNYNPEMEYRRLGKTELMVSAVCLGGHWKRVNVMGQDFDRNRYEVISRCMERGINYVDACTRDEVIAYSKALAGRRDRMYMALSYAGKEPREQEYRTSRKLLESLDSLLTDSRQEYTDLWRITSMAAGSKHSFADCCEIVAALEKAKKQGKARFIGVSSHDRKWLKFMAEYFKQIEVVLFPYTAKTKTMPKDSIFEALKKHDVGAFGIKPFSSNSIFDGLSSPKDPHAQKDDRTARLAIRYILCNPHVIPIPGLISTHQVDNVAEAVKERRELDIAEAKELTKRMEKAWTNLPNNYQWLKNWEYV
jgi:aryl-alcohol dehydrogenase-like predicted oxidoreductase